MSLTNLLDQTAELFQPVSTTDSYGSQTYTWPLTATATYPCRLQLLSKTVDLPVVGTPRNWLLFLPAAASVATVNDRIRIDGNWFDIVSVYPVHSPRGVHHMELVIIAYDGEVPH